jgi:hypothetical protein
MEGGANSLHGLVLWHNSSGNLTGSRAVEPWGVGRSLEGQLQGTLAELQQQGERGRLRCCVDLHAWCFGGLPCCFHLSSYVSSIIYPNVGPLWREVLQQVVQKSRWFADAACHQQVWLKMSSSCFLQSSTAASCVTA